MPHELPPEQADLIFDQIGSPYDKPVPPPITEEKELTEITVVVKGTPLASNNLKFNRKTGYPYRPTEHKQRIFTVAEYAEKACADLGIKVFPVFHKGLPLWMRAEFVFPYRKGDYRTGSHEHELKPNAPHWVTSKKDIDNILKPLKDGLSGIVYHDDSQVCRYDRIEKVYGEQPCSIITIGRLDNHDGQGTGGNRD